ncbi:hypothetical protein [Microscilla marina]|uniref:Lipoprotein, putative n=1 Tax=Microscilla marina ATCC 23134 TaxID=313606 RepID=A1ZKZ1_MICM2|nr:hypothetical protein [Microscilla marina]EAY28957.1 lipoprotein, putative [Microscilla marina ATCC 23134]
MYKTQRIYWTGYLFISLLLLGSCQVFDLPRQVIINTGEVSQVGFEEALATGNLVDLPEEKRNQVVRFGHCWDSVPAPTIAQNLNERTNLDSLVAFVSQVTSLQPNTTYYVRTYIEFSSGEVVYGNELSFTTLTLEEFLDLIVRMNSVDNVTSTSAQANAVLGVVVSRNPEQVIEYGFCWSGSNPQPTIADQVVNLGNPTDAGTFSTTLMGLLPATEYFVRAYAKGDNGNIAYSFDVTTFTTKR